MSDGTAEGVACHNEFIRWVGCHTVTDSTGDGTGEFIPSLGKANMHFTAENKIARPLCEDDVRDKIANIRGTTKGQHNFTPSVVNRSITSNAG
jgi:hypothetical protein